MNGSEAGRGKRICTRRSVLQILGTGGAASAVFGRALSAFAQSRTEITSEMVRQCAWIAGLDLTEDEIQLMLPDLRENHESFAAIRAVPLDNSVPPALFFRPLAGPDLAPARPLTQVNPSEPWTPPPTRPSSEEDLAFAPLTELAKLLRHRSISSVELTRLYLARLKRYDPLLDCVVTSTEELSLAQAERADEELARGRYRGPLHGIPWGAKDLLAVPGYRTTWGAKPYETQIREKKATVVARLEEAGAVLLAKLTLGALARGDVWFGGQTKNPWNPVQGASGSSAGPGAATAAGLVGFAIGSETRGSIVSPSTRNGVTGLRPTFGRVSRYGAMTLAWSMDKLGPMARSVEDCALVFACIHGADGLDPTAVDYPFHWPLDRDVRTLRVGFVPELFETDRTAEAGVETDEDRQGAREWQQYDLRTLDVLREMGVELRPVRLPGTYPVEALSFILATEAATAFDELTRSGRDDLLVRQIRGAWPNDFRRSQLTPAVEYLRANRIRTLVMREMEQAMAELDVLVVPTFGKDVVLLTNLTGHPALVVPNGFRSAHGTPTSVTFLGKLYGETELLAAGHAYQRATDFHSRRPPIDRFLAERAGYA